MVERANERTYGRTIFSELNFVGCIDNQIFLPLILAGERNPLSSGSVVFVLVGH